MELCLGLVANLSRMPMALSDSGKLIYPGSLWPPFSAVGDTRISFHLNNHSFYYHHQPPTTNQSILSSSISSKDIKEEYKLIGWWWLVGRDGEREW